jgi:hypothetical protein
MRHAILYLLLALAVPLTVAGDESQIPEPAKEDSLMSLPELELGELRIRTSEDRVLRQIIEQTPNREHALVVGERLVFSVRYGPIRAGEATLELAEIVDLPQGRAYRLLSKAKSNSFFTSFYKVDDHVESLMDVDFLFSRKHEKHLREGKYRQDRVVVLDQDNHLAVYSDGRVFEMPPRAHDILTAFYFVRAMDFEVGDVLRFDSHQDRKNYPIEVIVHREESVEVPAGKFDCLVIEPKVSDSALFKRKGDLWIWVTNDERKIPVLMKSKIPVGSIDAVLVRIEGRT